MLEVRMRFRIGMLLLEFHVAMELFHVLTKLVKLVVEVFGELLVANLLGAAVND